MAMCALCQGITVNKRGENGHGKLKPIRQPRQHYIGQSLVRYLLLKCSECGTTWRHEDDQNDKFAGWKAVA